MATTEVEICNLGLLRSGETVVITSLEDETPHARACRVAYPIARDALLTEPGTYWPFAQRRAELARLETEGLNLGGFRYAYALPSNMLTPMGIQPYTRNPRPDEEVPFRVEASQAGPGLWLLTDHPKPILEYIERVEEPSRFSPLFADTLAWRVALELVIPLSVKESLANQIRQAYLANLSKAATDTANWLQNDPDPLPETLAVRDW